VYDCNAERILFGENYNSKMGMASTTKIMTALIVLEHCMLNETVNIKPEWTGIEGSSMYLKADEVYTIEELLYGLLLSSGNDAAVALAAYTAGTQEKFVEYMNNKAQVLNMNNTHFENASGLNNETHYSTAFDMAKLASYAMKNEKFKKIVSTETININGKTYVNHNKLLNMLDNINGIKTGYTKMTGRCLVSSYENGLYNIVIVTLNDADDWKDHINCYKYVLENYLYTSLCEKNYIAYEANVVSGELDKVFVRYTEQFGLILTSDESDNIKFRTETTNILYAPIYESDYAGRVLFYLDDTFLKEVVLVYDASIAENVNHRNNFEKLLQFLLLNIAKIIYFW